LIPAKSAATVKARGYYICHVDLLTTCLGTINIDFLKDLR